MKSRILLFLVWVICSDIVVSYPYYQQYQQGPEYQPASNWPNHQSYTQNSRPVYPVQFEKFITHEAQPHHEPHFEHNLPVINSQQEAKPLVAHRPNEESLQKQVVNTSSQQADTRNSATKSQTEDNGHQPSASFVISLPVATNDDYQSAHPVPPLNPILDPESFPPQQQQQQYQYEVAYPHWQSNVPPQNYDYQQSAWPPVPLPNPALDPESYLPQQQQQHYQYEVAYPHWQSNVPPQNSYHVNPYNEQNMYNPLAPVEYPTQAQSQGAAGHNYQELTAKPEVKDHVLSQKTRYLVVYPNGTFEHLDVVEESVHEKATRINKSDLTNEYTRNLQDQSENKIKENSYKLEASDHKSYLTQNDYHNIKSDTAPTLHLNNENYTVANNVSPVVYNTNNYHEIPGFNNSPNPSYGNENSVTSSPSTPVWNKNNYHDVSSQYQSYTDKILPLNYLEDNEHIQNQYYNQQYSTPKDLPELTHYKKRTDATNLHDENTIVTHNQNPQRESNNGLCSNASQLNPSIEINHSEAPTGLLLAKQDDSKENTHFYNHKDTVTVSKTKISLNEAQSKDDYLKSEDSDELHILVVSDPGIYHAKDKMTSTSETESANNERNDATKNEVTPESVIIAASSNVDVDDNTFVIDFSKLTNKPLAWSRPDEEFQSKSYIQNIEDYGSTVFFDIAISPLIKKNSTIIMFEDGTIREEIIESAWRHRDDVHPRQVKTTIIMTYPDELIQEKADKTSDAVTSKE